MLFNQDALRIFERREHHLRFLALAQFRGALGIGNQRFFFRGDLG